MKDARDRERKFPDDPLEIVRAAFWCIVIAVIVLIAVATAAQPPH